MKALWLARNSTVGHTLPERNRSHAEPTATVATVALKHTTRCQALQNEIDGMIAGTYAESRSKAT